MRDREAITSILEKEYRIMFHAVDYFTIQKYLSMMQKIHDINTEILKKLIKQKKMEAGILERRRE